MVSPTELTTPVNGLTIVAWLSCCWASTRLALAASTADWSAARWAALTGTAPDPPPPLVLAAEADPAEAVPVVAVLPAEAVPVEEVPAGAAPVGGVPNG